MNIKEKIGMRIREERKRKELTQKELAELIEDFNLSRINNYERGHRTPGPLEIRKLAEALEVSPAYLMCLTDNKQQNNMIKGLLLPLLSNEEACDFDKFTKNIEESEKTLIPYSTKLTSAKNGAFALIVEDESMAPELRLHDLVIIDPSAPPIPGDLVLAKMGENKGVIIRKYKQTSISDDKNEYTLLALNENWADISSVTTEVELIGCVVNINRKLK